MPRAATSGSFESGRSFFGFAVTTSLRQRTHVYANYGASTRRRLALPKPPPDESELLLYVLSARAGIAWHTFKAVFEALFLRLAPMRMGDMYGAKFRRIQTRRPLGTPP